MVDRLALREGEVSGSAAHRGYAALLFACYTQASDAMLIAELSHALERIALEARADAS